MGLQNDFSEPFLQKIKARHFNAHGDFRLGEIYAKECLELDPILASGWALLAEALAGQNECMSFFDFHILRRLKFQCTLLWEGV